MPATPKPMRIVLFSSAYAPAVGGVEELTRRLAEQLLAGGDEVEVWTNRHPTSLPTRETIDGVRVRRFALPLPRMAPASLARFPASSARALWRLREAAAEFRPDVLHVQCFSANGVYAVALAEIVRIPLVVTLQGETFMDDYDIFDRSRVLPAALRIGMRRAAAVTACSRFVLDDAEQRFGLSRGKGQVVANGVDVVRDEPPVRLELPFETFVLGLGRAVDKKGFDLLLHAFRRVADDHPHIGLLIGGDGTARGALAQLAGDLGLADRVALPGTLSRAQVAWTMANATVFVLPSRVEPFGIVVLEALRAGRPVVVSSRGGAPEIVRHEREGLVADPFDTGALAAAMGRLLVDEGLGRRLSAAALERVRDFSWDGIAARYRQIYRDAKQGRGQ